LKRFHLKGCLAFLRDSLLNMVKQTDNNEILSENED